MKGEDSLENVPKAHAEHWKAQIHNFIGTQEDTVKAKVKPEVKVEAPKVEPKPEVVDVPETEVEEEIEETEDVPETEVEEETEKVEVEMSYSEMQEKAKECGMEKVGGISKVDLVQFIKDNS